MYYLAEIHINFFFLNEDILLFHCQTQVKKHF